MTRNSSQSVVQSALSNTQSTHSTGAQASAARVIQQLRADFPRPAEQPEYAMSHDEKEYLHYCLQHLMQHHRLPKPEEIRYKKPKSGLNINSVLYFVRAVLKQNCPPFNDDERLKLVCAEILRLVDLGKDHWTKNTYFDGAHEVGLDAGLDETLSLVCQGLLFPKAGYQALNVYQEEDKQARLLSLFYTLERLALEQICTAGRQHELLSLLNGVYPVKQASGRYQPISLIEDIDAFLLDRLYTYLAQQAKQTLSQQTLIAYARFWIKFQLNLEEELYPGLEAWLVHQQGQLLQYLLEQCLEFQLNPKPVQVKIKDYVSYYAAWNVPSEIHPLIPSLLEFYSITEDDNMVRSGAKMAVLNQIETAVCFDALVEPIGLFLEAEHLYQQIKKYSGLSVFLGEEEGLFQSAMLELGDLVNQRFYTLRPTACFTQAKIRFLAEERQFKSSHAFDYITNFFTNIVSAPELLEAQIARLIIMNKAQSLFLSDAMIQAFLAKRIGCIIHISPYQVNRVLLHALLRESVASHQETPLEYEEILVLIIRWIMEPADEENHINHAFQSSYPISFVKNILFLSLSKNLGFVKAAIGRKERRADYDLFFSDLIYDLTSDDTLTNEEKVQLWELVVPYVNYFIQNYSQLEQVLLLQLSKKTRDNIWSFVKDKLEHWVQHEHEFHALLVTNKPLLTQDMRQELLVLLQPRISLWVQNGYQLADCLISLFSEESEFIWSSVANNLKNIIQDGNQFIVLVQTVLNREQLCAVCETVKDNLDQLINNKEQLFYLLRLLSRHCIEKLLPERLLHAMTLCLSRLIQNGFVLGKILGLKLSPLMLGALWRALENNLEHLIQNGDQLIFVLSALHEQGMCDMQAELLTKMSSRLNGLIDNGAQLLFILQKNHSEQIRTKLLTIFDDRFSNREESVTRGPGFFNTEIRRGVSGAGELRQLSPSAS